jgi:hypothetical protein
VAKGAILDSDDLGPVRPQADSERPEQHEDKEGERLCEALDANSGSGPIPLNALPRWQSNPWRAIGQRFFPPRF